MKWTCTVLVESKPGYNAIPKEMTTEADSLLTAMAYFETFGKLLNTPRSI